MTFKTTKDLLANAPADVLHTADTVVKTANIVQTASAKIVKN